MRTAELREMVEGETDDNHKIENLLAQLEEGSEYLENQKEILSQIWNNFRGNVFTFYETERTQPVKKVGTLSSSISMRSAQPGLIYGRICQLGGMSGFQQRRHRKYRPGPGMRLESLVRMRALTFRRLKARLPLNRLETLSVEHRFANVLQY
jgi:hypothetical protein